MKDLGAALFKMGCHVVTEEFEKQPRYRSTAVLLFTSSYFFSFCRAKGAKRPAHEKNQSYGSLLTSCRQRSSVEP